MKRLSLFDPTYVLIKGLPFVHEDYLARIPKEKMAEISRENKALEWLSYHLSGGILCFETGFDLYVFDQNEFIFFDSIRPFPRQKEIRISIDLPQDKPVKIMMYTPLYARVISAHVHLEDDDLLKPYDPEFLGSMLWYGTSITQGACASRPGMSYTNQLSRSMHMEMINLGFSGNGLGELSIARVTHDINHLDAIIIDYEANAGAVGKLKDTLIPWIKVVREKHPFIPVIIISRIPFTREKWINEDRNKRMMHHLFQKEVVHNEKDLQPLYFIDGKTLIHNDETDVTVDGIHLNDVGMTLFAKRLKECFKDFKILSDKIKV